MTRCLKNTMNHCAENPVKELILQGNGLNQLHRGSHSCT